MSVSPHEHALEKLAERDAPPVDLAADNARLRAENEELRSELADLRHRREDAPYDAPPAAPGAPAVGHAADPRDLPHAPDTGGVPQSQWPSTTVAKEEKPNGTI